MIRGIAFDLEGTVVDVEMAHHQGHLLAAQQVGVSLDLNEALRLIPHFIGGPREAIAREIWDLSSKKVPVPKIVAADKQFYQELLPQIPITPRPGFLQVLDLLVSNGFLISVGSLTPRDQAKLLLEKSGLGQLFGRERIVLREDVRDVKPAPDVFFETARRMRMVPQNQLVFEDSPRGVEAAHRAGSRAIGMPVYRRTDTVSALFDAGAKRVFYDWREMNLLPLIENLNQEG